MRLALAFIKLSKQDLAKLVEEAHAPKNKAILVSDVVISLASLSLNSEIRVICDWLYDDSVVDILLLKTSVGNR